MADFICVALLFFLFPSISGASDAVPLLVSGGVQAGNPVQKINLIASAAAARVRHIKNTQNEPVPATTTALSPFSGVYSVALGFGTPPQLVPMVMDTGSSFSWIPCTKRYVCRNCSVSSVFVPKQSSSARIVGCLNPKCSWIHKSFDPSSSCPDCGSSGTNCTEICPPYVVLYGSGSTGGLAMVETLTVSHKSVPNFVVGCSVFAANLPAGIAGFGRGVASLPSQLGLKKFSYCLVSHKFDKTPRSSSLLLSDSESNSDQKTQNLSYTPLLKHPSLPGTNSLSEYYYLPLRKIAIGDKKASIAAEETSLNSNGNVGTIVDSGSTFTYMTRTVFDSVSEAFVEQVKDLKIAPDVEAATGLRPCFEGVRGNAVKMPELSLHFKGGAEMVLPLDNYFVAVVEGSREAVCLAVVSDGSPLGSETATGPAIILGNLFMQNYFVEFDLTNERFGFRQQICS